MRVIRHLLVLLLLFAALPAIGFAQEASDADAEAAEAPPPPPCGTQPMTIARMVWPSAALLAEIHSRVLTAHLQCNVQVQAGDMAAIGSSMGAMAGQKVRQAGPAYADTVFEGWFVPDYVRERWPEVTTIEGLKARAAEFTENGGGRGRFISCPLDWGCALVNRNMLRAYELDGLFEIVEPANRFELDTLIAEAVGRRQPILFYYWQPNAVLAQFAFSPVTLAAYDRDAFQCLGRAVCSSPVPTGFAPDPVVVALAEWVYLEAPQVAAYFSRARMPLEEMNLMLQQLGEPGATVEDIADRFIAERGSVWRPWAGLPAE